MAKKESGKPEIKDGYLPIARELHDAIIQTNFSKRQRSIIDFIVRLSYGCGRKDCIIPRQRDFEIAGIGEGHIKKEIEYLIKTKVICREESTYWLNKYYNEWRISINFSADKDRLDELVHLNLEDKKTYQNGENDDNETYRKGKIPEKELTEKVSSNLPKREVEEELSIENHSEKDLSITGYNSNSSYNRERGELLNPQPHKKLGGDSLSSLSPFGKQLDELLENWNKIKPDNGALQGCAHVLIWSYPAKQVVKKCFEAGYLLEDLKQAAINFQSNLNKKRGEWPATPLRIEVFYDALYVSYLPVNYGEKDVDDSEVPTFIGNV